MTVAVVVVVVVCAPELVVDSLLLHIVSFLVSRVEPQQGRLGKSGSPDTSPAGVIPGQC